MDPLSLQVLLLLFRVEPVVVVELPLDPLPLPLVAHLRLYQHLVQLLALPQSLPRLRDLVLHHLPRHYLVLQLKAALLQVLHCLLICLVCHLVLLLQLIGTGEERVNVVAGWSLRQCELLLDGVCFLLLGLNRVPPFLLVLLLGGQDHALLVLLEEFLDLGADVVDLLGEE